MKITDEIVQQTTGANCLVATAQIIANGNEKKCTCPRLKDAHRLVSQFEGGYSRDFSDAREFAAALGSAIREFEIGSNKMSKDLWVWFAPTCQWDDFVRSEGIELGELIYGELNHNRETYGIKL